MSAEADARADWARYQRDAMTADEAQAMQRRLLNDEAYAVAWLAEGRFEADLRDLVRARAKRHETGHASKPLPVIPSAPTGRTAPVREPRRRRARPRGSRARAMRGLLAPAAVIAIAVVAVAFWLRTPSADVALPNSERDAIATLHPATGVAVTMLDGTLVRDAQSLARGDAWRSDGAVRVTWADHTTVWLPHGGAAEVIGDGLRVNHGTARAEVLPQATPFRIQTPHSTVTVLGTQFTVVVDDHGTDVTVIEGRVTVDQRADGEHHVLGPGDVVSSRAQPAWWGAEVSQQAPGAAFGPQAVLRWSGQAWRADQILPTTPGSPGDWRCTGNPWSLGDSVAAAADSRAAVWLVLPWSWPDHELERLGLWLATHAPAGQPVYLQFGHECWNRTSAIGAQIFADLADSGRPANETIAVQVTSQRTATVVERWQELGVAAQGVASVPHRADWLAAHSAEILHGLQLVSARPGLQIAWHEHGADAVTEAEWQRKLAAFTSRTAEQEPLPAWLRQHELTALGFDGRPEIWWPPGIDQATKAKYYQRLATAPGYRQAAAARVMWWRESGLMRVLVGDATVVHP